jgi:heme-degrading monooxygenase HmoA
MQEVAVLVKLRIAPEDVPRVREYRAKNVKVQKSTSGFRSMTVWQSQVDATSYLLIVGYADDAAAEEGLRASLDAGGLVASLNRVETAPEVRRGAVVFHHGKQPPQVPVGSYASLSVRVAEPGRGRELQSELSRIFGELSLIDGYLGSAVCASETLSEEAVGLVFWHNPQAFQMSLPNKALYDVAFYRRTI